MKSMYSDQFALDVRSKIERLFEGRFTITFQEAAKLLNMDQKVLRQHLRRGNITCVEVGLGSERPRRRFTFADLAEFVIGRRRREVPVQRASRRAPKLTMSTAGEGFLAYANRVGSAKAALGQQKAAQAKVVRKVRADLSNGFSDEPSS